jgi:hypothetical protein
MTKKHVFKSKYRKDRISLAKAHYRTNPDGSKMVVSPQVWAEFDYNTWSTTNQEQADLLRKRIADGEDTGNPLPSIHVIDTTKGLPAE